MFRMFHGKSADAVWCQVADAFRNGEPVRRQSSRAGDTREILRAAISIECPRERWVISRNVPINPAFALAEVVWIVSGRNDAEFLKYFNRRLPKFAGFDPQFHGAYGHRLRKHHGIDQLTRAYEALDSACDSRQVVLQIWDVDSDFPQTNGDPAAADIPCNIGSMLKIRNGRLEWTQVVRSNDAYLGLPYNLIQFTTLQELIAGWLGVSLGEYGQISDSLHVYEDTFELVAGTEPVKPVENTDVLQMDKAESESGFRELARLVEEVITESLSSRQLVQLVQNAGLKEPLQNMLCVLCAESARRRKFVDSIYRVMECCTNPLYGYVFDRWLNRFPETTKSQSCALPV